MLGGAFLLSLSAVAVATAAADAGAPYTGLGSRRAMTFAALAEPARIFVFFTVLVVAPGAVAFAR